MKRRLDAHEHNLQTALDAVDSLDIISQERRQARTHLQEALMLVQETIRLLRRTEDTGDSPEPELRSINIVETDYIGYFLTHEIDQLEVTALCSVTASQEERARVLFAQAVFTQARVHVLLVYNWMVK